MNSRTVAPALVIGLLAFAAQPAEAPRTDRYRFTLETESMTDLTELGQGEMESRVMMVGSFSVTIEDGEAGPVVDIVLDSLSGESEGQGGGQLTEALLAEAQGVSWRGTLDEKGRITDLESADSSQVAGQIERGIFRSLLPYVMEGAKVGDTWSDTLNFSDESPQGSQTTTRYLTYTATADTTVHRQAALRVDATTSSTVSIYQESQGLDIDGSSSGTASLYIGKNGTYLGSVSENTVDLLVTGATLPAEIPVTVHNTIVIELLP